MKSPPIDEILVDEEVKSVIASLGVGICPREGDLRVFDLGRLRYEKIIIVFEATAEATYVREQVVGFLQGFMTPLVAGGFVHLIQLERFSEMNEEEFHAMVFISDTRTLMPLQLRR